MEPLDGALREEHIRARLHEQKARPAARRHYPPGTRRAAVLIPMIAAPSGWELLYIRRTESVAEHKGQVAFPGGAVEAQDASIEDTALRETWEEVGLPGANVEVLGRLPDFFTITNFLVTPVVGRIHTPFELVISTDEVSRAFTIPLRWLADPANYEERPYPRPNGRVVQVVFFQPYDGEILWGATARITLNFLRVLKLN